MAEEQDQLQALLTRQVLTRRRFIALAGAGLLLPEIADAKKKKKKHRKKHHAKPTPTATPTPVTIANVATAHGIEFGVITGIGDVSYQPWVAAFAANYNVGLIADVLMKNVDSRYPDFWPAPYEHNFGFVDTEVSFLKNHGVPIYWEPLLSGTVYPADWLVNGTFTADEMQQIIQSHITTVMNRYQSSIHHWNVVTEPIPQGWTGDDPFSKVLGDAYIDLAFETARSIDPSAVLTFVDNGGPTPSAEKYQWDIQTVRRLRNKTVTVNGHAYPLIDRMNVECYIDIANPPAPDDLGTAVDGFRQLGVDVQVDIMVSIGTSQPTTDQLAQQADVFRTAMTAYLQHGVKTFINWGMQDGGSFPVGMHAALFDQNFQPKPAYQAVVEVLQDPPPVTQPAPLPPSLGNAASKIGVGIGTYLGSPTTDNSGLALSIELEQCNLAAIPLWWNNTEPTQGAFDPTGQELWAQTAALNGIPALGTPVVGSYPAWLQNGNFTSDQLTAIIKARIQSVLGATPGQIGTYVLVDGAGSGDPFWQVIGPGYLELAFGFARTNYPNVKLLYGAFDAYASGGDGAAPTKQIVQQLDAHNLIDGVALSMQLDATARPDRSDMLQTFQSYGVPVYVKDLDVNLRNVTGSQSDRFALQAQIFQDVVYAALASGVCKNILFWSLTDKTSTEETLPQLSGYSPSANPALFDDNFQPKPAFDAVLSLLQSPP